MKLLKRILVSVFLLIASVIPFQHSAQAEPGDVQRWLMRTPTSLWTFGLSELRATVYGWEGDSTIAQSAKGVVYEWDKNRLVIFIINENKVFSESLCGSIIDELRAKGYVSEGELFGGLESSLYAQSFQRGFSSGDEPDNYLQKIDNIIELRVQLEGGNCKGDLLSTSIYYQ